MSNKSMPADFLKETSQNPTITTIFTADPSAHVWEDGKVYIYASHDMDPARGCDLMDRYHVFSSEDMVNWIDEGEILRSDDVAWGRPEGGFMWAPDCAYRNGTYYFYYPHPSGSKWNDTWKMGVATSQNPASGFTDRGYITGLGGFAMIDPCVLVDDDGRAYMYYGGGSKCAGGELNEDMMAIKGEMSEMVGLEDFHEAAWVFKRAGLYYLTYSDNLDNHNRMRYATSVNPLGPWTYRGVFLEPTGCSTSHGSVAEYKGQWYMFYHNQAISNQGNLRSVCIDRLYFNEDGTIQTVVQTKTGVPPVAPAPAPNPHQKTYSAENSAVGGGATLETVVRGNARVARVHQDGSYCQFDQIDGDRGGRAALYIRYATAERLAKLHLTVNGEDHSLLNAPSSGSDSDFSGRASITVRLRPGSDNAIRFAGGNGNIRIESMTVSPFMD
ncbi:family 43 glycosylhydrolase [Cohnella herbarum]|uniref:Family 43 glycosylhydrolase n=1 Tax=Cohnella herbarum TaxID=2728023 RepID=A0A7Z2ZQH8_9BACL|nr:family 43 glycosylhydrolase [Cohnella herbarum]QJD87037.1 family 43 glycosylhydrolase [Cohnella herbarum]